MELKDFATVLAPAAAILVALATMAFNIYDRRKHYAIEKEKLQMERQRIAKEMSRALLSGSKTFEKRVELYNRVMQCMSRISAIADANLTLLRENGRISWGDRIMAKELDVAIEAIRSGQALTSKIIHEGITRDYAVKVVRLERKVSDLAAGVSQQDSESIANCLSQIIAAGDQAKDRLRSDLEAYVLGIERLQ